MIVIKVIVDYKYSKIKEGKRKMGFLSNLFGGGEKKPAPEANEMKSSNPTDELEAIRAKNQAEVKSSQDTRLGNLQAGASEAGVAPSSDRYGQKSAEQSNPSAPEVSTTSPEVSASSTPEHPASSDEQVNNSPETSDDQKAA